MQWKDHRFSSGCATGVPFSVGLDAFGLTGSVFFGFRISLLLRC